MPGKNVARLARSPEKILPSRNVENKKDIN
jgi:hypothetical protein